MHKTQAYLWLSPADRATLQDWSAGRNTPQKVVWRSRIVLLSAEGVGLMAIERAVGKSNVTVSRWQKRYLAQGISDLRNVCGEWNRVALAWNVKRMFARGGAT